MTVIQPEIIMSTMLNRRLPWLGNSIVVERIVRSGGFAGGLAKYFNMDPTIVRIIFVASLLGGTLGLWVYIIMAVIVPQESEGDTAT